MTDSNIEAFETLLSEWESESLDPEGVQRLQELLRSDEEVQQHYVRHQLISAALKLDFDAGVDGGINEPVDTQIETPADVRPVAASPLPARHRWSLLIAAAAGLLICLLSARLLQLEFAEKQPQPEQRKASQDVASRDQLQEPTSEGIALVTRLIDVQWSEDQLPLEEGDAISAGRFAFDSGYAQIEFFCGATVIVEGPAELDLKSPLLAKVKNGRLRAQVPPAARGFSLEVDEMKVVDLGTEFGLSVTPEGADVQVFDGEVEVQNADQKKRLLQAGDGVVRSPDGSFAESEVTPDRFLDIEKLGSRAADEQNQRFERWQSASDELRRDERLIAYYAFDGSNNGWRRRLKSSLLPQDSELDGAIVGARQVAGRWASKGGLEFKRPGDRVRVTIPGEYSSLTFACWVKIDSLDRWYNSLFLTDHYDQGEPHWQILDTGQLFFSVRHKANEVNDQNIGKPSHQVVLSPPFWKPSLSGRWLHLATSYEAETRKVTHYLNGKVLHEEIVSEELAVPVTQIGAASIGNWSIPTESDAEFAIRNLNGSMDEFAIFSAALTADEISQLFADGRP